MTEENKGTIDPVCPLCGRSNLRYVQRCTEYHNVQAIYEDGNVDLSHLDDSYPDDDFYINCGDCDENLVISNGALVKVATAKDKLLTLLGLDSPEELDQDMLDELVHDYKAHESSAVNNSGEDAQIKYILEQME